jgi:xylulokinase
LSEVVLGLDLGTGGVRVIAVDLQGKVITQATGSYPLLTPRPGWTEQRPSDWVEASFAALTEASQKLEGKQILAMGLSGQMHGMVPLNAEGAVLRPAILWNDQRTGRAVDEIEAAIPRQELIQRTGNPAITGFQLAKVVWLRAEEPQAFAQLKQVLLPKDYLGYVLTGELVTEPSDASGTNCFNLSDRQWDVDVLQAMQIDPALFPTVVDSRAIAGRLKPDLAAKLGLPAGLPIIAGGGDNAAAAIGLGISSTRLHRGSLSIGTSGVIFAPLDRPIPTPDGRAHLFCHADGGYHLLGVTLAAGGALRWYRDVFAPTATYDELMAQVQQVPPGARGILFLPHLAGERTPYLDPDARGAWVNLSLAHSQSDLVRAVLEGVAYSLRAALEVVETITPLHNLIATGGGARSTVWLQIFADILGTKLTLPKLEEGAAYGAALLAMIGAKAYPNLEAVFAQLPQEEAVLEPVSHAIYEQEFDRFRQLYTALKAVR